MLLINNFVITNLLWSHGENQRSSLKFPLFAIIILGLINSIFLGNVIKTTKKQVAIRLEPSLSSFSQLFIDLY